MPKDFPARLTSSGVPVLKKSRWLLLKREENLKTEQRFRFRDLLRYNLKTVRAYLLKEAFQQLWDYNSPGHGPESSSMTGIGKSGGRRQEGSGSGCRTVGVGRPFQPRGNRFTFAGVRGRLPARGPATRQRHNTHGRMNLRDDVGIQVK